MEAKQQELTPQEQAYFEHVRQAKEEGLTLKGYCERRGLKVGSLYGVRRHLMEKGILPRVLPPKTKAKTRTKTKGSGKFVAVRLADDEPSGGQAVCRVRHPRRGERVPVSGRMWQFLYAMVQDPLVERLRASSMARVEVALKRNADSAMTSLSGGRRSGGQRGMRTNVARSLLAALTLALLAAPWLPSGRDGARADESRPVPRWPDGRVNLGAPPGESGMWSGFGSRPMLFELDVVPPGSIIVHDDPDDLPADRFPKPKYSEVPFQPWAKALFEQRARNRFEPYTRCKPSAGPRFIATAYGTQFVDLPELRRLYIFPTGGPRTYRVVYMDGRGHPEPLVPSYLGHSIGRWEGDTLIVETAGFNEGMWIDAEGSPHTERLRLVERFTRIDFDTLRYEVTIDDPGAYIEPWSSGFFMTWESGEAFEFVCQDLNLAPTLMVGTDYDSIDRHSPIVP